MSFFKGFGELYTATGKFTDTTTRPVPVGPAIVQEIQLVAEDNPEDVGRIRLKSVQVSSREEDDKTIHYAYPADRRNVSYPLPGEQVFIFMAISDEIDEKTGNPVVRAYYNTSLTQNGSITYNSLPNIGDRTAEPTKLTKRIQRFTQTLLKKILSNFNSIDRFINSTSENGVDGVEVKERPSLQPYEGDVIHQGRFGQSIRFTSTSGKSSDTQWSKEGLPGNPITIIRVHDEIVDGDVTYVTEDINKDNSSIYLASTQNIPLKLSCGTKMLSWQTTYKLEPPTGTAVRRANIESSKSNTPAAYLSAEKIAANQISADAATAERQTPGGS